MANEEEAKNLGGRPTKCTPELIEEFASYMASGLYLEDAAGLCYITPTTAHNWFSWGQAALDAANNDLSAVPEEKQPYARFFKTVRAAEARAISASLALVQRGARDRRKPKDEDGEPLLPGDWRAAEAFLKMRKPDTWGERKQRTEVTGKNAGPVVFHVWELSDDTAEETEGD